jgi:hypothetical protein
MDVTVVVSASLPDWCVLLYWRADSAGGKSAADRHSPLSRKDQTRENN